MNTIKPGRDNFGTVPEQLFQLTTYKKGVSHVSQPAEGNAVMNDVCHFNAAIYRLEMVLVVPETVGAITLFVHKKTTVLHMGDLCHPVKRDTQHRPDLILDDLPCINMAAMRLADHLEAERGRRNMLQVAGIAEIIPGMIQGNGQYLCFT